MSISAKLGEDGLPTLKLPPGLPESRFSSGYSTPSVASTSAKHAYPSVARSGALMKTARKSGYLEIR